MDNIKNENDEPQSSPGASKETIELAVKLLLKLINSKQQYEETNEFIYLIITLESRSHSATKIPHTSEYIPVPHPLFSIDGSKNTCLIIGDENERLNAEVAEKKIKEEGLPISKVFELSKLRADYGKGKDFIKLRRSFDFFMASKSVFPAVSEFYFAIRDRTIPVDLTHKHWREELELACSLTHISIRHSCRVAKVAMVSQTSKEIVENIVAVIDSLVSKIPEKWNNISSMNLISSHCVCPLYQSFPGKVGREGPSRKKRAKHGGKAPDAKRKKVLSSEGKAGKGGSVDGLNVGDAVPKDDFPAASGLENQNKSVDLQEEVSPKSVEATTENKMS